MNRKQQIGKRQSARREMIEGLEGRQLMSASVAAASFVYVETNNPSAGQNAVIAYRSNPVSGELREIGQFATGGTGFLNAGEKLGPDDSDKEVIVSADGRFLFAVNQGSGSVTTFEIKANGGLERVGSFGSGGVQPVSLSMAGNQLFVLNRGDEIQGETGTVAPSIASFQVGKGGGLTLESTVGLGAGLSPSQVLAGREGKFLFADAFTPPPLLNVSGANEVVPFTIGADGTLTAVAGGAAGATVTPPLVLGLAQHPTERIIYAGLTGASAVGVFTYDANGKATFVGSVATEGKGPCWCTVSRDGKYLYTTDTGTDSVGVFSLADPLHPKQIQEFVLGGPHNASGDATAPSELGAFEFSLDPTGRTLYVMTHETTTADDFPQGNALHVLSVANDGTLSEQSGSTQFLTGLPAGTHPQGVAVVSVRSVVDNPAEAHRLDLLALRPHIQAEVARIEAELSKVGGAKLRIVQTSLVTRTAGRSTSGPAVTIDGIAAS